MRRTIFTIICLAVMAQFSRCTKSSPKDIVGGVENGNGYVSGFVYKADGNPAAGAVVRMTPVDYVPSFGFSKKASVLPCTTDIHGHYVVFTRIDSGVYNMEAVRDTAGALLDSIKVTGDTGQTVKDAYLHALGGISGISFMPGQSDTNQVRVTIYMPGTRRITKPVIGGRFSFDDVPAGHYQMIFDPTLNLYHLKILDVNVSPGQIRDLDTVFLYGDSITGIPKVNAGNDTTVSYSDTIRLHGRATDPYGKIVKLEWDIGATGHFSTTGTGDTTIIAVAARDTSIACVLRATDNDSNVVCDTIRVQVIKDVPIANAGMDTLVSINDTIRLHGSGTDRFSKIVKYEWDIGAKGTFSQVSSADTAIIAGTAEDSSFMCIIRVINSKGNSLPDTVRIKIIRDIPVADAGRDTTVPRNTMVLLKGSNSKHRFGNLLYEWDLGNTGVFVRVSTGDTTIITPNIFFDVFPCILRVTNDDGDIAKDTIKYFINNTWQLATSTPEFGNRSGYTMASFNNKLWVIGGMLPTKDHDQNDVWVSEDGKTWSLVTDSADFPPRSMHSSFEFNGKLWVIGGVEYDKRITEGQYYFCRDDAWYSTDGLHWTCATDSAPFGGRFYLASVVFNNAMWVIGGCNICNDGPPIYNDVWFSYDGTVWQKAADSAGVGLSFGSNISAIVFFHQLWVWGEQNVNNGYFLTSDDGTNWTKNNTPITNGPINAIMYDYQPWFILGNPTNDPDTKNKMWTSNWRDVSAPSGITKLSLNGYIYPIAVLKDMMFIGADNGIWYFK
jgi:hypothetical protein